MNPNVYIWQCFEWTFLDIEIRVLLKRCQNEHIVLSFEKAHLNSVEEIS